MTEHADLSAQRVAHAKELANILGPALTDAAAAAIDAAKSVHHTAEVLLRCSAYPAGSLDGADRQAEQIAGALAELKRQIGVLAESAAAAVAAAERVAL